MTAARTRRAPVVAIIPARGGSKGVPRKNVRPVLGLPLVAHSVQQARAAKLVDHVLVSTDDAEIARASRKAGAQIVQRPAPLSGDTCTSESALLHALDSFVAEHGVEPALIVFLQCTSPIRARGDIDAAIRTLRKEKADSLLSVSPNHRFLWKRGVQGAVSINYDYRHRKRRQDLEPQYVENGSIYVFKPAVLRKRNNRLGGKIALHVMSEEAAFEIDSVSDLKIVSMLMQRIHGH